MYSSPASDYLAALYEASAPKIDESFPIASDEFEYQYKLIEGFEKVARGLVLINELCEIEDRVWQKIDSNSSVMVGRPCFPISSFGYLLAKDAARLAEAFEHFIMDGQLDLVGFFEQLYDYTHNSLVVEPLTIGDFFGYLEQAILLFAEKDFSNEAYLILAYINDVNDPACDFSNDFHKKIFEKLSDRYLGKIDSSTVLVDRVYVGYLMSIVATNEGVEFWKYAEEYQLEGDSFNENYIGGAIYRNDKMQPSTAEEWLEVVSPVGIGQSDYNHGIAFGRRCYASIEEARLAENSVMAKVQKSFRDFDA